MLTLSTLVVLLVEQCASNVPREHDFKFVFQKCPKFSSLANPVLARCSLCVGGRGDYLFMSTCPSIEVIILQISSQTYHFRFKSAREIHDTYICQGTLQKASVRGPVRLVQYGLFILTFELLSV